MNTWIKCSERLPEDEELVVVYVHSPIKGNSGIYIGCYVFDAWQIQAYWESFDSLVEEESVTYWMPLSEPPKEEA